MVVSEQSMPATWSSYLLLILGFGWDMVMIERTAAFKVMVLSVRLKYVMSIDPAAQYIRVLSPASIARVDRALVSRLCRRAQLAFK